MVWFVNTEHKTTEMCSRAVSVAFSRHRCESKRNMRNFSSSILGTPMEKIRLCITWKKTFSCFYSLLWYITFYSLCFTVCKYNVHLLFRSKTTLYSEWYFTICIHVVFRQFENQLHANFTSSSHRPSFCSWAPGLYCFVCLCFGPRVFLPKFANCNWWILLVAIRTYSYICCVFCSDGVSVEGCWGTQVSAKRAVART